MTASIGGGLFDLDLMAVSLGRMRHAAARQQVIATNIAHADTPDRTAEDLTPFDFAAALGAARGRRAGASLAAPGTLSRTHLSHLGQAEPGLGAAGDAEAVASWEVLPGGNAIQLEQQMLALAETKLRHDQAAAFYKKSAEFLRAAASGRF